MRRRLILALALGAMASSGCVHRSLSILTDPPGAKVYVNEQLKGVSPVDYDFMWYGWHRVTISKDGYERLDDKKLIKAPIYLWIPFDLAMELLPFPIHDNRHWAFTLSPVIDQSPTPPPLEGLRTETHVKTEAAGNTGTVAPSKQEWKK